MKPATPPDPNPCRPRHFRPGPCGPAPQDGPGTQVLETSHTRLIITGILLALAFVVIGGRLVEVAGFKSEDARLARVVPATHSLAGRADIIDRNGALLATTLRTPSLYADPKEVLNARETAKVRSLSIGRRRLRPAVSRSAITFWHRQLGCLANTLGTDGRINARLVS